jgi:hypothetical protein
VELTYTPTPTAYLPPIGEVLAPQAVPIQEYHAELQATARTHRSALAKIAFYGFRMRLNDGWTALGFESGPRGEEAYREALDISRSTWYKAVRIGQSLHQLTLEDLTKIPTTNAELLIQVNPTIIHDYAWVREAQTLKPARMAELVTQRNKSVGDDREPLASFSVRVPFLAKHAMEGMLEAVRHKYNLSSNGQALELMIADLHNDANLISSVNQALQLLQGVMLSMERREAPDSEEKLWLQMAKEVLHEGYEKAVQTARQKSDRNQKGGRS